MGEALVIAIVRAAVKDTTLLDNALVIGIAAAAVGAILGGMASFLVARWQMRQARDDAIWQMQITNY